MPNNGNVHLVGTVHPSPESRERVTEVIQDENPDYVAIELDQERLEALHERAQVSSSGNEMEEQLEDLLEGMDDDEPGKVLLQALFRFTQGNMFDGFELSPGEGDMLPAAEEANDMGTPVALIDQDKENTMEDLVDVTFSADALVSAATFLMDERKRERWLDTFQEYQNFMEEQGLTPSPDLEPGDMESPLDLFNQQQADPQEMLDAFEEMGMEEVERMMELTERLFPSQHDILIRKRNQVMAGRLQWLRENGYDTVAVVGKGHVPGMAEMLENPERIPDRYVTEPSEADYPPN